MEAYEIVFYEQSDGHIPVVEFINSFDLRMQAKIVRTIKLLEVNGNSLRMPFSKALDNGIFELRVQTGNDITRVLYFFYIGKRIVLTNGFVKKTQKTPKLEIERAERYRADFLQRL